MELLATLSEDRSSERENSGNQPSSPVSDNSESTEEKMISDTPVMKANNDAKPATPDDTAERSQSPASKNSMYRKYMKHIAVSVLMYIYMHTYI